MNREFEFLKIIENTLDDSSFLGDDCAYLDEYKIALSSDSLVENVHFSRNFMTPEEIGKKSLLVNISDIITSGAKPEYALISLSGNLESDFVEGFYKGVNKIAQKFNVKIIGGDLTGGKEITISITAVGNYKNRKISSRKNAKDGYTIAVAGEFGSSAQGLEFLANNILSEEAEFFIEKHKTPELFPKIAEKIALEADFPYAMMDSSDGLFDCLYQISQKSGVKINIDYEKIPNKTKNRDFVLFGGEDYSLVAALHENDFKKIEGLTKIGQCSKGCGVFVDGAKIEYKGFNHFE